MKATSLCSVWKKNFLVRTMHGLLPKVVEITTVFGRSYNQGTSPFCHVFCLGMHTYVMPKRIEYKEATLGFGRRRILNFEVF
jgi:hypothetical protein